MKQVEKTQIENLDADLMTIETHMQTITNQKQTISNQAKIIEAIEQIIASKDRDNQLLAEKNYTQSCILARLNQEKTEDVKRINDLTGKLEMKDKTILRLVGTQSSDTGIAEKITNIHNFIQEFARGFNEEFSRKRKADDWVWVGLGWVVIGWDGFGWDRFGFVWVGFGWNFIKT